MSKKRLKPPAGPIRPPRRETGFLRGRTPKIVIIVIIAVLVTSTYAAYIVSQGPQPKAVIVNWQILVFAGSYNATHFVTPAKSNIEAKGSFTATGGNGNILVWIVSDYDYQTYVRVGSNPPPSTTNYDSGTVHTGSFDIHLPPSGNFWIVFTDNFNEGRAVTASGFLYY